MSTINIDTTSPIVFGHQNNTIVLSTSSTYVNKDIQLDVNVTTAVLTTASPTNTFDIQIPNGAGTVKLNFSVDSSGNVVVT